MPVRESSIISSRLDESNDSDEFYELDMEPFHCPSCGATVDVSNYFCHVHDVHGLFPCLYCLQNFKTSKELMLHLTQEHDIEAQKFSNSNDFLDKGGVDTLLACVECNKIFESDTLPTSTKIHSQECRNSTGVCPKCETIHSLKSLGEHIVHCGAPVKQSSGDSTVVTTSSLRNRDNSCKYCGQKFSISTIAAHVRACPNQSTKSTYNVWNGNSTPKSPLQIDNQVSVPNPARFSSSPESRRTSLKVVDGLQDATRRNGLPELPKLQPAPRIRMKSRHVDDEPLPSLSPKENLSVDEADLVPLRGKDSVASRLSPVKDTRKKINGTNAVFKQKQKTKSGRKKKGEKYASPIIEDGYSLPPSSVEDMHVEEPEDKPPIPPVYVDQLIREQDDDKRLSLLIQELADKIVENCLRNDIPDVVQSAEPPLECKDTVKRYEVVLDDSPSKKSDSWILNEMIVKSSFDCSYCKLVRLIRVDKRQLVIHLLTKHSWDLSVAPCTAPTVKSDSEIANSVLPPCEEQENAVKIELSESNPLRSSDSLEALVSSPGVIPFEIEEKRGLPNLESSTQSTMEAHPIEDVGDAKSEAVLLDTSTETYTTEGVKDAEPKAALLQSPTQSLTETNPVENVNDAESKAVLMETSTDKILLSVSSSLQEREDRPDISPVPETPVDAVNHDLISDRESELIETNTTQHNITFASTENDESGQGLRARSSTVSETSDNGLNGSALDIDKTADCDLLTLETNPDKPDEDTGNSCAKEDANQIDQPMTENVKQEILQSDDNVAIVGSLKDPVRQKLSWSSFKLDLLEKVFRSTEIVFACTDVTSGSFGERPCHCLICGQSAETQKGLFPHWRRIHRGAVMRCTLCKGKFLFAGALYSHLCVGTPQPLTLFPIEKEDEEGVGDHTVGLRYQCGACDDVLLPGFFNLMVHLRKDHNQCELCLESLESQKDLEHHVKKHKLNHFCWKCSVSYCAKPNFMTHLFWKHGTESVDCSKCLKKKWPHIYHFCIPPEYFVCDVCGLYFTRPMALRVHKRFHTGEKLKRCPKISCGERFVSKKLLQRHIETVHPKPQPNNPILPVEAQNDSTKAEITESPDSETPGTLPPAVQSDASPHYVTADVKGCEDEPALPSDQKSCPEDSEAGERRDTSEPGTPYQISAEPVEDGKLANNQSPSRPDGEDSADAGTIDESLVKDPVSLKDELVDVEKSPTMEVDEEKPNGPAEIVDGAEVEPPEVSDPQPPSLEKSPILDRKPAKRFNLAEIQGPNLSEDESESDADEVQKSSPTPTSELVENLISDEPCISPTTHPTDNELDLRGLSPLSNTLSASLEQVTKNGITRSVPSSLNLSEDDSDDDDGMDTSRTNNELINPMNLPDTDEEVACKETGLSHVPELSSEDMEMLDNCVDKMKHVDDFGSMSPLLPPLDDFNFSVPEIPTFEENRLPEHIIQENALFSIQHEHDYSVMSTNIFGIKRKPLSPAYSSGNLYHGSNWPPSETQCSPSRGRSKKTKSSKSSSKSPKKRKRSRSSSSSSSSSSSCSSCGSDCSCSSCSSGSSSSSSSGSDSSESEDERRLTPVKSKKYSKSRSPSHSSPKGKHSPKKKIVNNGKLPKVKSPKKPKRGRGRPPKEKIVPEIPIEEPEPEPEKEPEPMILESDLETDDSGSEEIFHKQQLSEDVGAVKPACDEIWDMKSEKFLLRLVRGVNDLVELQPIPEPEPPPPVVYKKEKVKYSVKGSSNPQPKLKVRNIPIKPLIVKRNVPVGNYPVDKFYTGTSPTFHMPNSDSPISSAGKGKKRSLKSTLKLKKTVKTLSDGSAFTRYEGFSPAESIDGFSSGTESISKKRRKSKKNLDNFDALSLPPMPEAYVDEKLYCVCQCPHDNVSQMIGCDGKDCQYKWFHFECVGICIPPKGKWFCSECREKRRRKAAAKLKEQEED